MDAAPIDQAFRELIRRLNEKPDEVSLIAQACYGYNIRSYHDSCIDLARNGLAKEPYHAGLYYELVIASSLDTGNILQELLSELKALLKARPSDLENMRNLALAHYYLEQDEEAENLLRSILNQSDSFNVDRQTYEVLAQLEYTRQNMEECIQYCEKAIERPGSSVRMVRLKGLCYQELGDLEQAKKSFQFALELEPCFVWACHSLGVLCLEQGDYPAAFRYFGNASYINPMDPGNLFLLAEAFMDMEKYDLALAELNKLLMCEPDSRIEAEVHNALGYLWIKQNDPERARRHLTRAIEQEPELAVAYYNLGQLHRLDQVDNLAETNFKTALSLDPMHVESMVELGFLFLERKEYGQAEKQFFAALDVEPLEALAYLGLSKTSQKAKDYHHQLAYAMRAHEIDPDHSEIWHNLGIAHECNKNLEAAEEAYISTLDLEPLHSQAANNLGYLYESMIKTFPDQSSKYTLLAVEAWKKRLRICTTLKRSTKGAVTHLTKLGVSQKEIENVAQMPFEVS